MSEMRARVAIVDYELANMFSVKLACEHVGLDPVITSDASVIENSDAVILPGVGAFGEAMANLNRLGLVDPLKRYVDSGRPFFGICLGMQLLFSESEEFGTTAGLGLIPGTVRRFPASVEGRKLVIPQIGWNRITPPPGGSWDASPLADTPPGEYMYFLHSLYCAPENTGDVLCITSYERFEYCSGVARENVVGLQFHPEKSAQRGIDIYRSFAALIAAGHLEPS